MSLLQATDEARHSQSERESDVSPFVSMLSSQAGIVPNESVEVVSGMRSDDVRGRALTGTAAELRSRSVPWRLALPGQGHARREATTVPTASAPPPSPPPTGVTPETHPIN